MDPEVPAEQLRVGDDERERVVTALHAHASRGRLDAEELDARVEQALHARTRGELDVLLRDLPDERAPAQRPARPRQAVARFRHHAGVWAVMSVFFVVLWALSDSGSFWPVWPILGWGLAVALQGVKLLTAGDEVDETGDKPDALPRGA
jgi:hypothetical protein